MANPFIEVHHSGLGQDAVIEIMVALLGVMIAVLTLIAGIAAIGFAALGIFGYQSIRDEAKKRAEDTAGLIAEKTARRIADRTMSEIREQAQASGLSEGQAEELKPDRPKGERRIRTGRKKATSDSSLEKD